MGTFVSNCGPPDTAHRRSLQRSMLSVPAVSQRFLEKAAASAADTVFIDLEDSIAPAMKAHARAQAVAALNGLQWADKTVGVRINSLESSCGLRDVLDIVSQAQRLDFILAPSVQRAFDIEHLNALLTALEREQPREQPVAIQAIIETPAGLAHVEQIASAAPRLEALAFGLGDFSINMEAPDSLLDPDTQQWTYALTRIATACRASGLRPIDGPFTAYSDLAGLRERASLAARYGFEGKWVIHPAQIAICNEVFSPSQAQIDWARKTLELLREATAQGSGAIGHRGALLDMAHVRLAQKILARADQARAIAP